MYRSTTTDIVTGHVVFSCQPDPHLHGQHRFAESTKVRAVLELALAPGAPMVVFHDENYQRVGGGAGVPYQPFSRLLSMVLYCSRV